VKLIVGLGNPGKRYKFQRHNIGFEIVEELASRNSISLAKRSFKAIIGVGSIEGEAVILANPQTYMNLSGESVSSLMGYYRIIPEDLLVVHDDLDFDLGRMKLVFSAGGAGHRGVGSIMESLGTKAFYRLRVGIGRPPERMDPADFVLQKFPSGSEDLVKGLIDSAVDKIKEFLLGSRIGRKPEE